MTNEEHEQWLSLQTIDLDYIAHLARKGLKMDPEKKLRWVGPVNWAYTSAENPELQRRISSKTILVQDDQKNEYEILIQLRESGFKS